jgi:Biopterin-dependent aromatic amino acid hydroxylase
MLCARRCVQFPITKYQPRYFVAESLAEAKQKMRAYCEVRYHMSCTLQLHMASNCV